MEVVLRLFATAANALGAFERLSTTTSDLAWLVTLLDASEVA